MATQTQAQSRQSQLDALDSLGTSRDRFETGDVFTAAENDVADFIERVKANIQAAKMIVTGGIDDIKVKVTEDSILVLGNEYLLYQDKGVRGSVSGAKAPDSPYAYSTLPPPVEVFVEWIKRTNMNLVNESQFFTPDHPFKELTEEEKIEKVAYAMQQKIFKEGFKPRNIFSKELPQLKEDLKKSIKDFGANTIKDAFKQPLKK